MTGRATVVVTLPNGEHVGTVHVTADMLRRMLRVWYGHAVDRGGLMRREPRAWTATGDAPDVYALHDDEGRVTMRVTVTTG